MIFEEKNGWTLDMLLYNLSKDHKKVLTVGLKSATTKKQGWEFAHREQITQVAQRK